MIDRGQVIEIAFAKLGETGLFNDDRTLIYDTATTLLNNIIDNIASDRDFLFNSTIVNLTSTGNTNALEHKEFNRPVDFLNEIKVIDPTGFDKNDPVPSIMMPVGYFERTKMVAYLTGEFYYANKDEIVLIYCRKITLQEFPNYLQPYLVYALAVEMAHAFTTYNHKLDEMYSLQEKAYAQAKSNEGSQYANITSSGGEYNG